MHAMCGVDIGGYMGELSSIGHVEEFTLIGANFGESTPFVVAMRELIPYMVALWEVYKIEKYDHTAQPPL